ncbi:hypothetical protein HYT54_02270 [Candidatus Woesearchaeota archaeon]|nr:hypothetical protein [Candidatus Woesearchaeota archaeon]
MHIPFRKHANYDPLGDCGRGKCPVCARQIALLNLKSRITKENFSTDAVAPFVGKYGYPNINVGIMAPPEEKDDSWLYDAPRHWAVNNYEIPRIVDFRSSLLNSRYVINVRSMNKMLELSQDVAMASRPVDIEINIQEKPKFRINTDSHMAPYGPNAKLKNAKLESNPKIHTKVYKVFSDIDMKANDAMVYLYKSNFDENFLSRIMSVGTLGLRKSRKLVPTRWSITASDDIIGKNLIDEIKDYPETGYNAFFGDYLGNYYLILTFPEVWGYELFETYIPPNCGFGFELKSTTDHERYDGRKNYAENTVGGYYSVRLAILEKLKGMKRQASVLALRFITDEYSMPLGVWVTREAARKSLASKPIEFSSKELMLNYAKLLVKKKFGWNAGKLLDKSILMKSLRSQTKLAKFIN